MSNIGDLIKRKRTEENFSQRKLAELCGMSYSHICRLEKGENIPTLDTITKIANALGLPPSAFTFNDDGEFSEPMKQYIAQLAVKETDLFLNLVEYINENHCVDKFDLRVLGVNGNFEDIRGLIIDVVKSRLNTYTQNENK